MPAMRMPAAPLLCLNALLLPAFACPQSVALQAIEAGDDIVVRGVQVAQADTTALFEARWSEVPGAAPFFRVKHAAGPASGGPVMLDRVVEAGLAAYLDTRVRFARHGVDTDLLPERMVQELDGLVTAACEAYGTAALFGGFSDPTIAQLGRLLRIDWSRMAAPIDAAGHDKYLAIYRYVRGQRDELERSIRADLLPLAAVPVTGTPESDTDRRAEVRINSTCGTVFDEENFLCALDLRLADADMGAVDPRPDPALFEGIAARATATAPAPAPEVKVRKRDRWLKGELDRINARIGEIDQRKELWVLRDRMDDIEDRITGMDLELRAMKQGGAPAPDNPIASLSHLTGRNITVRFARNITDLDAEARVLLNEVFEQLARSPGQKVLVTGYTDRSGDPATNLRLSEQRARSVRNYLLMRGIEAERLLVNFYGDSRSTGRDPLERRVEVEWLP
jgi:outer membrane protein OmpA-like peptidoglycan-associated protein